MGECVVKTIRAAEAQYQRLILLMNELMIKQHNLITLFEKKTIYNCLTPAPVRQLIDRHLGCLKTDVQLFSRMNISCQ